MQLNEAASDLLTRTPEGSLRIVGTRITLDSIVQIFRDGATPEEICQDFPTLSLAQVYSVLAFYLTHAHEVHAYMIEQEEAALALHRELQVRHASFLADLRQRLVARRASSTSHA